MSPRRPGSGRVVIDASAVVDLLLGGVRGAAVQSRLRGVALCAPAHLDAEVLSALGRLNRTGQVSTQDVAQRIRTLAAAPVQRHPLPELLPGAWRRRTNLALLDALYVELAARLQVPLVTTDRRVAREASTAEYVGTAGTDPPVE